MVSKTRLKIHRLSHCKIDELMRLCVDADRIRAGKHRQPDHGPPEDELKAAGCEKIFRDVTSGAKASRPGLDAMLAQARRGDVIVVVRLDRLGRSLIHLVSTVEKLERDKIGFRSLSENIDSTSAGGKLILHIFASLAQFERALITERVRAGLDSARARGRVGGRPPKDDRPRQAMAAAMLADPANSVRDVCRALKVSRATAFRLAKEGRKAFKEPSAATTPADAPARTRTRVALPSRKATSKAARGVPLSAAPKGGKVAASSPKTAARATVRAKTLTTPAKGSRKATNTSKSK